MTGSDPKISHPGGGRFALLMIIIIVFLMIALFQARNHQGNIQAVPATQPQPSR